ncbi:uncharacterized protein METZ01_LOCUS410871 [marine metagenome]|uniref:Uncharacterized protein n=1 Tax=marine metagenome TaxID=408172 RepID=A0A382WGQ4_9ZZZZ
MYDIELDDDLFPIYVSQRTGGLILPELKKSVMDYIGLIQFLNEVKISLFPI